MKKLFTLVVVCLIMVVNISVSSAALVPVSGDDIDTLYSKIRAFTGRTSISLNFTKLVPMGESDFQIGVTGETKRLSLLAGQSGLKNSNRYQCLMSYGMDKQNRVMAMTFENSSRDKQGDDVCGTMWVSALFAIGLNREEIDELFNKFRIEEKKDSDHINVNVWSSNQNKYIVVLYSKLSVGILASDTKVY